MEADNASEVASEARLKQDTLCVKCGYNLRTLSREGRCPECGASVAASLVVGPFGGAGRRWMMRVAVGLGLLLVADGLMMLGLVLEDDWPEWMKVAYAAGPGGPKAAVAGEVLRGGDGRWVAVLSLLVHAVAVVMVMWPEGRGMVRWVKMIGLSGVSIGVLVFGAMVAVRWRPMPWTYYEALRWLLLLDVVAIAVMNLRIAEIASRGQQRVARNFIWVSMGGQVAGFLLLAATIGLNEDWVVVWVFAAFLQAAGAAAVSVICLGVIVVLIEARKRAIG